MASIFCQNDLLLLSIAREVGRKVALMGLDSDFHRHWYSPAERDAFMDGWLEAAAESSDEGDFCATYHYPSNSSGRTEC